MPAAMLTPDRPPPEDYYQNNCRTLFEFVLEHYAQLLNEQQLQQLRGYAALADDAQRLFARLLTRKGPLLRIDSLRYAEVGDLDQALNELCGAKLIALNPDVPADQLLSMLRKAEVATLGGSSLPASARKDALVSEQLSRCSDAQIVGRVRKRVGWLRIAEPQTWRLVRLLYFGDSEQDWSAFVLRDLGTVRYETLPLHAKRFTSREQLATDLYYRKLSAMSRRLAEYPRLAPDLTTLLQKRLQEDSQDIEDRFNESRRARSLLRIGRWYEREGRADAAVQTYSGLTVHPARERIVRVLHRHGHEQAAQQWLQNIQRSPFSEEEAQFAERFGKRQAGYQPPVTRIDIDVAQPDIEQQALALLLTPGAWGAHVENSLVRTLTGLVYWPVIFAEVAGAFTNPFQFGPNDLYHDDFLEPRQRVLADLEQTLADDTFFIRHLRETATAKEGVANSLVNWQLFTHFQLEDILAAMPLDHIRRLTGFLIRNLHSRRAGLPDLFVVYGPGHYEFVEVKGPGDQLQPGQRIWFKHLQRLEIPARVLKLRLVN